MMICLFLSVLFGNRVTAPPYELPKCKKDSPYYVSLYNAYERIYNFQITKNDKFSSLDDFSNCIVKYDIESEGHYYKSQFTLELTRCCSRIGHPDCKKEWKIHILNCAYSYDDKIDSAVKRARLKYTKHGDEQSEILKNIRKIYYGENNEWKTVYPPTEYFHSFYEAFERYPNSSLTQDNKLSDLDDFSECTVQYIIYARKTFTEDELKLVLNECCIKTKDEDCEKEWKGNIFNYWYKHQEAFLPAYDRAVSRENDEKLFINIEKMNLGHGKKLKHYGQMFNPK